MPQRHEGEVALAHSFAQVYGWLRANDRCDLKTEQGTPFEACSATTTEGQHAGEDVIRFFQSGQEYGRAYECCWGHYHNCNRTRIGMYCKALDREVGRPGNAGAIGERDNEARIDELIKTRALLSDLLKSIDDRMKALGYEASVGRRRRAQQDQGTLRRSSTVSGKPFYYDGSIRRSLTIYPTGRNGVRPSGSQVPIGQQEVNFVRAEIRRAGEVPMGACRDNPVRGSLGEKLRGQRRSPQLLSYVIPLLAEQDFCKYFKRGRRYIVRHAEHDRR